MVSLLAGLCAHPSSALWLPATRTAILADVHLGYSWAQRRRGELGPLADFRTREKLLATVDALEPSEIVFLGDLVHAPRPCGPEREWIEGTLSELSQRAALVAVRGNHDRAFAREFGHLPVTLCEHWSNPLVNAVHGDRLKIAPITDQKTLIVGHLHPCLGIIDAAGASQKLPVFLANRACVVLPAFSPFARGYDILSGLPDDLAACFSNDPVEAHAATPTRVVRLGPLRRAVERMRESARLPAEAGRP
ncbi:MAG: metallophosphoesterase [Acidobacteriota bacterium]|nr:metallophosphoesterase [Acidobacteriota bacterium]